MFFTEVQNKRYALFVCLMGMYLVAHAFGFSPTLLSLSAKEPIASLAITNESDDAITLQIKPVRWLQENGEKVKEVYQPTQTLVVTPQIFSVAPHGSTLVRVGLEDPIFTKKEQAFRIFVQEVVPQFKRKQSQGLTMALRINLPVIVRAEGAVKHNLQWSSRVVSPGQVAVMANNLGNTIVFIDLLQALTNNHKPLGKSITTFAYLLPGTKKSWIMDVASAGSLRSVKANVNDEISFFNVQ